MYIHTVRSGKERQYVKRLLRVGRRDGRRVQNRTVANLTGWTDDQHQALQQGLLAQRACKGTPLHGAANQWLLSFLLSNGVEWWRLCQEDVGLYKAAC